MYEGLVQPIAILKDSGTHEDVIVAAARASLGSWIVSRDLPEWEEWLAGSFTKSVRCGNRVRFSASKQVSQFAVSQGEAQAAGFAPMKYEDFTQQLSRMQVSGSEFERTHDWPESTEGPTLMINAGLGMSSGKIAAQVSHGLFMWALSLTWTERIAWFDAGMPLSILEVVEGWEGVLTAADFRVADAGFTEIEEGSVTVAVFKHSI